jgi:hypothetical protein
MATYFKVIDNRTYLKRLFSLFDFRKTYLPMLLLATACFPPVEYFVLLVRHRKATIDLHETYPKQTWRNRYLIVSGNGPVNLSVPVEKIHGNHTKTKDILISSHSNWHQNHWKTIYSSYRNAPFFVYYCDLVEQLILHNLEGSLSSFNRKVLDSLVSELGLSVEIDYTEEFVKDSTAWLDMRFGISPKNKVDNRNPSITLASYYQVFQDRHGFIPNASILDLIFNLGPDTGEYLEKVAVIADV